MLEEITSIYEIHRWARYAIWTILLIMALLLIWVSGGIPPSAWRELPGNVEHLSQAWAMHGRGVLFSLMGLALASLVWLLAWSLMLWAILSLLWHHWRWRQREREMAEMLSSHGTSPLLQVLPIRKESHPARKITPMPLAEAMEDAMGNDHSMHKPTDDGEDEEDSTTYTVSVPLLRLPHRQALQSLRIAEKRDVDLSASANSPTDPRSASTITTQPTSRTAQSLKVGVGWHTGKKRRGSPNEDSLAVLQGIFTGQDRLIPFGLLVVADGMGGHAYGREASSIAIQTVTHVVVQDIISGDATEDPDEWFISLLTRSVEQANQGICALSDETGKGKETGTGTTLTAALVCQSKAYVVNVGDSRTYLYREREGLVQITKDHSLVAHLVESGEIKPDDVYTHPNRNQVYRSVGNPRGVDVDWFIADVRVGDRLLLCSDGLWEMVRDPVIEEIVGSKVTITVVSERLMRAALAGGGADNISVVVAEVV